MTERNQWLKVGIEKARRPKVRTDIVRRLLTGTEESQRLKADEGFRLLHREWKGVQRSRLSRRERAAQDCRME